MEVIQMTPERKTRRECPNAPRQDYETYVLYLYGEHSEYALIKIFNECESSRVFRSFEALSATSFKIEAKWNMSKLSNWIDAMNSMLHYSSYEAYVSWNPPKNPYVTVPVTEFTNLTLN
jgi:hypothetical protein